MKAILATTVVALLTMASIAKEPDPKRWEKTIAAFEAKDKKNAPPKDAILFTGSSSIALWSDIARAFPEYPVINRAFGGSTLPEVNHFVDRIIIPYKPRLVVLFCGSNDVAGLGHSPEQVLASFQEFVKKVHGSLPQTEVLYLSIHTPPGRVKLREKFAKTNQLIAQECTKPRLTYVNIHDCMLDKSGEPDPANYRDPLHPTARAYDRWVEILRPLFKAKYSSQ